MEFDDPRLLFPGGGTAVQRAQEEKRQQQASRNRKLLTIAGVAATAAAIVTIVVLARRSSPASTQSLSGSTGATRGVGGGGGVSLVGAEVALRIPSGRYLSAGRHTVVSHISHDEVWVLVPVGESGTVYIRTVSGLFLGAAAGSTTLSFQRSPDRGIPWRVAPDASGKTVSFTAASGGSLFVSDSDTLSIGTAAPTPIELVRVRPAL